MNSVPPLASRPDVSAFALEPRAWGAAQLTVGFMVDAANISRGGADLLEPLLLTAILEANQAHLSHDVALQRRYGSAASALPDDLRRPISVAAVARSLRLPFETVRRRVQGLIQASVCVAAPDGVYVPQAVVTSTPFMAIQAARVERLARFHQDLLQIGVVGPDEARPSLDPAVRRAVDRACGQYMLRACDPVMALTGGAVPGMVLLGLCAANTAGLTPADLASGQPVYAALGRPCAVPVLADQIGVPRETLRRRLHALEAAGFARRRGQGWIAAAPAAARPELARMASDNLANIRRLFARLRELDA